MRYREIVEAYRRDKETKRRRWKLHRVKRPQTVVSPANHTGKHSRNFTGATLIDIGSAVGVDKLGCPKFVDTIPYAVGGFDIGTFL